MPHKPGFIHSGKDETSWNYFELPFGSGADYKKPIALENLPYTPAVLGEMLENKEKEREIEIEGLGKGRLIISKQNKNKPFFYPNQSEEYIAKKSRQLQIGEIAGNLPLLTSPLTTLGKGVPRIIQSKTQQKIDYAKMYAKESNLKNPINLKQSIDGAYSMPTQQSANYYKRAANVAKKNHISLTDAFKYLDSIQKGIRPDKPIKPGNITGITNKGLLKDTDVDDPTVYIPPEERIGTQKGDPLMIDLGLPSFGQPTRKESVTEYRNRHFNAAQFEKNKDGNYIYDDRKVIKNLKGEPRRLTTQLAQTKPGQTVKRSFENTREKTKYSFIDELGGYMTLTGSKPNLHHRFAPQVTAPLYRYLVLDDKPGTEWMQLTEFLNSKGIYPGSPVSDPSSLGGPESNLTQLVTKGVNQRVVLPDGTEKLIHRPPEPHDILHHQYYKKLGLQDVEEGKASWFDKRMYKITGSFEGRMEVARELADIINEGDRIIDAAMDQIRALFGNKTDPQVITDLLSEMAQTGKLKITGTKYRLKSVEAIVKIIQDEVKANMPLSDEFEVMKIVESYNLDADAEIDAIDLLHNIADYNESMRVFGKRPPSISHKKHQDNVKAYMKLIQPTLFDVDILTKEKAIKSYTYKRVKPQPIEKQLELLFSDD